MPKDLYDSDPLEEVEFYTLPQEKITPCCKCNGVINPLFYRVEITQIGFHMNSVQQHQGLTLMLGGHSELAHAMGTGIQATNLQKWANNLCIKCQNELMDTIHIFFNDTAQGE